MRTWDARNVLITLSLSKLQGFGLPNLTSNSVIAHSATSAYLALMLALIGQLVPYITPRIDMAADQSEETCQSITQGTWNLGMWENTPLDLQMGIFQLEYIFQLDLALSISYYGIVFMWY